MLIDTNIIIYCIQAPHQSLRDLIAQNLPSFSAISFVEALGFHKIADQDKQDITRLLGGLQMLNIDRPVLDRAVFLRQQRRMSVGDAVIAATALVHDKILVTHNTSDFRWISDLRLLDPLVAAPPQP
jgi:toxin FitB